MARTMEEMNDLYVHMGIVLSSTFALYLKTHNFHWNVTGPDFPQLHKMLNKQYDDIWDSVDMIAEKIRMLGFFAPGAMKYYTAMSQIEEEISVPSASDMVAQLKNDHKKLIDDILYPAFREAEKLGLQDLMDFLTGRIDAHNKMHWMLDATSKQ